MKSQTHKFKAVLTLAALAALTVVGRTAVVVDFGETVPTSDIITSYDPGTQSTLGWLRTSDTNRIVAQTFITPGTPDYLVSSISMKLHFTVGQSFPAPSGFAIDFYQLTSPGQNPESGTYLSTQLGTMQPTTSTATAGSYLSFGLDTPVALQAGVSYGYVLSFMEVQEYNLLHLAISDAAADPDGTRAWFRQNGGPWGLADGQTYVYYIEGSAIPEPGTIALLGVGAGLVLIMRRKSQAEQA